MRDKNGFQNLFQFVLFNHNFQIGFDSHWQDRDYFVNLNPIFFRCCKNFGHHKSWTFGFIWPSWAEQSSQASSHSNGAPRRHSMNRIYEVFFGFICVTSWKISFLILSCVAACFTLSVFFQQNICSSRWTRPTQSWQRTSVASTKSSLYSFLPKAAVWPEKWDKKLPDFMEILPKPSPNPSITKLHDFFYLIFSFRQLVLAHTAIKTIQNTLEVTKFYI